MKKLLFLFLLLSETVFAQQGLVFDKRFAECEDKWVAFEMNKDSSYAFGFIYVDAMAGFTLEYRGDFKIDASSNFIPNSIDTTKASYKKRLQPSQVRVAILPREKLIQLNVSEYPDQLKMYKGDTASIAHLYRWGYNYNAFDEPVKALIYLEKAWEMDPAYQGLATELAYSYNALQQYEKALNILKSVKGPTADDCYFYKEYSFTVIHLKDMDMAQSVSKKAISTCTDTKLKAQIAYNLAYEYYKVKNRPDFNSWAEEARKWTITGDRFDKNLKTMEANFDKKN